MIVCTRTALLIVCNSSKTILLMYAPKIESTFPSFIYRAGNLNPLDTVTDSSSAHCHSNRYNYILPFMIGIIKVKFCLYRESDVRQWLPGETLPLFVPDSPIASSTPFPPCVVSDMPQLPSHPTVIDMLQSLKSSVEMQLSSVVDGLASISERMARMENKQIVLEKEIKEDSKNKVLPSPGKGKRRHIVPVALQVNEMITILVLIQYFILFVVMC